MIKRLVVSFGTTYTIHENSFEFLKIIHKLLKNTVLKIRMRRILHEIH